MSRTVTPRGNVVRYLKSGSIQIMYANGNYAEYAKKTGTWTRTKNDGTRRAWKPKDGTLVPIEPELSVETRVDPETNAVSHVRADGVMRIFYTDGAVFTQHHDGTCMLQNADRS